MVSGVAEPGGVVSCCSVMAGAVSGGAVLNGVVRRRDQIIELNDAVVVYE